MVANLFRKTNLTSWILSFVGIFLVLNFFHTNPSVYREGQLYTSFFALGKSCVVLLLIGILIYTKSKNRYVNIPPFILLCFPLELLFIPAEGIQFDGLILNVFLLITFLDLSTLERTRETIKPLFNISLNVTFLTFFEPKLYLLFFTVFLVLVLKKQINLRAILAVITPFLVINFLFYTFKVVFNFEHDWAFWEIEKVVYNLNSVEFLSYLAFCLFMLLLILFSKTSLRIIGSNLSALFLLNLIGVGALVLLVNNEGPFNFYEIVLSPLIFMTGLALEGRSNRQVNTLIYILLLLKAIVIFYLL